MLRGSLRLPVRGEGKLPDIHFVVPGFVRVIRDPSPVRRELSPGFVEFRSLKKYWLLLVSLYGKNPDTRRLTPRDNVKQEASVRRPAIGILRLIRLQQRFLILDAAGQLLIQVPGAVAV